MLRSRRRLLLLAAALPVLVVAVALVYALGMASLEGQPRDFWSALEWSAETLTTTGYGRDAHWQHPLMVLFVVAVQFAGVFLVFLVVPVYLIPFLEERFEARLPREARVRERHVVIYRHGPAVVTLIDELRRSNVPYLVIEEDETVARRLLDDREPVLYRTLEEGSLAAAHIGTARALIANGADAENAAVILSARQLEFEGPILAMVEEPVHRQPIMLAGANGVFTPRHVLAAALADRASDRVGPRLSGAQPLGRNLEVVEIQVQPRAPLAGRSLAEAQVGARTGATVIGQWVEGRLVTRPEPSTVIQPRSILVAVGGPAAVARLAELAGHSSTPRSSGPIVIAGYGEVGRKVAELLRGVGEDLCVIEKRPGPDVTVVGDALDNAVLERAGVRRARGVVLALNSDAATLFATVIVRDLEPQVPIIARVNQAANVQRIHRAGASFALSVSQIAGQILAHHLLGKEIVTIDPQLRLMKVAARPLTGRTIGELDVRGRTGCSVVAVERGDAEVQTMLGRDFVLRDQDTVYICGSDEDTRRYLEVFGPE